MSKGNMSVVCLVDSSKKEEYDQLHEILWSALDFFGVPYETLDLAKANASLKTLQDHSAIVIGQEHLGASLSESITEAIVEAVKSGTGLVCFDGDLHSYKDPLKDALGLWTSKVGTHMPHLDTWGVRIWDNKHFITGAKELEFVRFNKAVNVCNVVNIEKDYRLLVTVANSSGLPAVVAETCGKGRVVLFAVSPKIWLNEYFGHGGGLDDVFWKSIVWAAKKPFVMLAMPPFVTIRIDDCSGAPNRFGWVWTLNRHGFVPHVSLFTENIGEEEAQAIKELYDAGAAEFSFHAFTWTKQIFWEPKSPRDHDTGREYSEEEMTGFFRRMDELSRKWSIEWSKVLTAHFGEVGKNVVPFIKERGIVYLGIPYTFGIPYGAAPLNLPESQLKKVKPFKGQGGIIDRHPEYPELFVVYPSYEDVPKTVQQMLMDNGVTAPNGQKYDFLWETGRDKVDTELGAWFAAFGVKLALDSLFPAVLVTHEQNISVLNDEEWDSLLAKVDQLTSKHAKAFRSWTYIAEYAKNLQNLRIKHVAVDPENNELECRLTGQTEMPLFLHVFRGDSEHVDQSFMVVPPCEAEVSVRLKPTDALLKNF